MTGATLTAGGAGAAFVSAPARAQPKSSKGSKGSKDQTGRARLLPGRPALAFDASMGFALGMTLLSPGRRAYRSSG